MLWLLQVWLLQVEVMGYGDTAREGVSNMINERAWSCGFWLSMEQQLRKNGLPFFPRIVIML